MGTIRLLFHTAILVAATTWGVMADEVKEPDTLNKPKIENLLTSVLGGADGLEVILSHVTLPPNAALPKHWHPGEEFAYILKGSVTVLLEGQNEIEVSEGGVGVVPFKHVHSARSGSEGATILVFRVHEQGQPGRTLVKE